MEWSLRCTDYKTTTGHGKFSKKAAEHHFSTLNGSLASGDFGGFLKAVSDRKRIFAQPSACAGTGTGLGESGPNKQGVDKISISNEAVMTRVKVIELQTASNYSCC